MGQKAAVDKHHRPPRIGGNCLHWSMCATTVTQYRWRQVYDCNPGADTIYVNHQHADCVSDYNPFNLDCLAKGEYPIVSDKQATNCHALEQELTSKDAFPRMIHDSCGIGTREVNKSTNASACTSSVTKIVPKVGLIAQSTRNICRKAVNPTTGTNTDAYVQSDGPSAKLRKISSMRQWDHADSTKSWVDNHTPCFQTCWPCDYKEKEGECPAANSRYGCITAHIEVKYNNMVDKYKCPLSYNSAVFKGGRGVSLVESCNPTPSNTLWKLHQVGYISFYAMPTVHNNSNNWNSGSPIIMQSRSMPTAEKNHHVEISPEGQDATLFWDIEVQQKVSGCDTHADWQQHSSTNGDLYRFGRQNAHRWNPNTFYEYPVMQALAVNVNVLTGL